MTSTNDVVDGRQQPFWGCGLLGDLPNIDPNDGARGDTQTLIDGLKVTNKKDGKVTYWNWNFAPEKNQVLTEDFVFIPTNWGVGAIPPNEHCGGNECLHKAGESPFFDGNGNRCTATMGDILLGANEPDIIGSCMGDVMGKCLGPCTNDEVVGGDCPVAHLASHDSAAANSQGHCDCWTDSHATGVGFWTFPEASSVYQPLPTCWEHQDCIDLVMNNWKEISSKAVERGYEFLSAPMVAVSMDWMRNFIIHACHDDCSDMSCGCPTHVSWHFYANDCQPKSGGGYKDFQRKLDATVKLMEDFPHLQGAFVNEVGMLNCAMDTPDAICVPNGPGQTYPANSQPNHACPSTSDLPDGLATFVETLLRMVSNSNTSDGRRAVVGFTWFNEDMVGGTYNLRLFDDGGKLNTLGKRYIQMCQAWADGTLQERPTLPPLHGSDNKDTLVQYATDHILLLAVVIVLSICFCCCGFCWGTIVAKRRHARDLLVALREQKADRQARGRFVKVQATDVDDQDDEQGISFANEVVDFSRDPTAEHNNEGGWEEGDLELAEMDGEESKIGRLKNEL